MLDRHLAGLYGVTTTALNQAVKRNHERFPSDFMFRLTVSERDEVITLCDNLTALRFSPVLPNAFTQDGVAMLSGVLRSSRAVQINIQIMRTFTRLRALAGSHEELSRRVAELERRFGRTDSRISEILDSIRSLTEPVLEPRLAIGLRSDA